LRSDLSIVLRIRMILLNTGVLADWLTGKTRGLAACPQLARSCLSFVGAASGRDDQISDDRIATGARSRQPIKFHMRR